MMMGGGVQPHALHPDKVVTASGHVITRPKSKQQQKKSRQQQAALAAQNSSNSGHHSKFIELRKL